MNLLCMVGEVGQQMECGGVSRGNVVVVRGFYCGRVGCWVDVVVDMGICWADVGDGGSGVNNGIFMWFY